MALGSDSSLRLWVTEVPDEAVQRNADVIIAISISTKVRDKVIQETKEMIGSPKILNAYAVYQIMNKKKIDACFWTPDFIRDRWTLEHLRCCERRLMLNCYQQGTFPEDFAALQQLTCRKHNSILIVHWRNSGREMMSNELVFFWNKCHLEQNAEIDAVGVRPVGIVTWNFVGRVFFSVNREKHIHRCIIIVVSCGRQMRKGSLVFFGEDLFYTAPYACPQVSKVCLLQTFLKNSCPFRVMPTFMNLSVVFFHVM